MHDGTGHMVPLPGQTHPPPGQTPPCPVHAEIHPPAECMLGYGQQAGGTHPTQMHSCLLIILYGCVYVYLCKSISF